MVTGLSRTTRRSTSLRPVIRAKGSSDILSREPKHVEWVRGWYGLLEELRKYVMEYHTTGLAWNPSVSRPVLVLYDSLLMP